MKRNIVTIDEEKCTGCGICIPNCHEGALQIIDGKARLISDLFCDGLGACLGNCPEEAITIEEREASPYNEKEVMKTITKQGNAVIQAHLSHLKEHCETGYLMEAIDYLKENNIPLNNLKEIRMENKTETHCACPGSVAMEIDRKNTRPEMEKSRQVSRLNQWPVQLHLINPDATYFKSADVLLTADCVAYALGNFHEDYLKGKRLIIACPKLDSGKEVYIEKLKTLIDVAKINTLTIMMMEVPCCHGLLQFSELAASQAQRKVPIKTIVVSIQGEVVSEEWI